MIKHDARIVAYMDKDEKEFEAEREEKEKSRLLGYDYIKALNKQRHEHQLMQKSKKYSAQVEINTDIIYQGEWKEMRSPFISYFEIFTFTFRNLYVI